MRRKNTTFMPRNDTREAYARIDEVRMGLRSSGNTSLIKYLSGERLTHKKAILAKCADCMGYYVDGKADCKVDLCPLYPFAPYREVEHGK